MRTSMRKSGYFGQTFIYQPVDILRIERLSIISDEETGGIDPYEFSTSSTIRLDFILQFLTKRYETLLISLAQHLKLHGLGIDIAIEQTHKFGSAHTRHI